MLTNTALTWWSLNVLTRRRYELLKTAFGDLDAALAAIDGQMLRGLGMKEETVTATLKRLRTLDIAKEQARLDAKGVGFCTIEDELYPSKLREIADPPVFLSWIGDLSILDHPCIGVVGTRGMSPYGRRVTEAFVPMFARSGCVTVSGHDGSRWRNGRRARARTREYSPENERTACGENRREWGTARQ
jgi:predicted Rossmann fold nucleotide-binding protein DprA/Smf involved in DNA uptake